MGIGTHRQSGDAKPVHRALWRREGQAIDVHSGDLCERNGTAWIPLWTGILLENGQAVLSSSIDLRFQHIVEGKAKPRRSSIAAETQCELWLKELVHRHPERRLWSKAELFTEARKRWDGLSGEAFERAWSSATANEAGQNWRKAGAIPKGPRPVIPPPE